RPSNEPSHQNTMATPQTHSQRSYILEGSVTRGILKLSWPIAASMFLQFALGFTDFYWIGDLGASAQDAMTSSLIIVWTLMSLAALITIGVNALVARNYGSQDFKRAGFIGGQALKLSVIVGFSVAALGYFSSEWLMFFMGADELVASQGAAYLRIFFLASPLLFVMETFSAIFRATGDTKRPMIVSIMGVGLNIILDPILIFGWGPAPEMGVAGAALGTFLSLFADIALYTIFVYRGRLPFSLSGVWKDKLDSAAALAIAKIGAPLSAQHLTFVGVYTGLIQIVHRFGNISGAAMGIGNRLESLNYLICVAFSLAASSMIGQSLGAGKPERAERAAWTAAGFGVLLTATTMTMFLLAPDTLSSIFTSDPAVKEIARSYLIIVGYSQCMMAIEIVIDGAFSGAGDTVPPMLISIPGSLARIPLAYYLAIDQGLGVSGVWWAITITTTIKACLLAYWFNRGNWKLKKVY
ncbi:MATE family efflux transporter, partial [Gemmatimonas aurantiaca]|nr:MATE family efflux transporter [Gemmatimonas aurantiaca]